MSYVILPLIRKQEILISSAKHADTRPKTMRYATPENQKNYVVRRFVRLIAFD